MEVLEDEHDRLRRALGAEEVLPGAAHLVAHQHRVLPRGAELHALVVGEAGADELAEELRDAPQIGAGEATADARGGSFWRRTSSGSPSRMPRGAAERLARAARTASRRCSGSPRPIQISTAAPRPRTRRRNS